MINRAALLSPILKLNLIFLLLNSLLLVFPHVRVHTPNLSKGCKLLLAKAIWCFKWHNNTLTCSKTAFSSWEMNCFYVQSFHVLVWCTQTPLGSWYELIITFRGFFICCRNLLMALPLLVSGLMAVVISAQNHERWALFKGTARGKQRKCVEISWIIWNPLFCYFKLSLS